MIPLLFWVKLLSGPSAINGALPIPVDCEWGAFTDWTSCSKTCGQGSQVKTRDIFREPVNGGKPCEGPKIQKRNCIPRVECPGNSMFCLHVILWFNLITQH